MEAYKDSSLSPEVRAKDLLEKLSLDEKMAQLSGIFALKGKDEELAKLTRHGIGQVSTLEFRECKSVEEVSAWQRKLQTEIMERSGHHIPAVFHMEGLSGAFIQDSTSFPSGVNRGSSFDTELEEKIGEIVARQELTFGITQILAPVLDISRDSRMGRQCEPYGEDPSLTAAMGASYTKGIQSTEVDGRRADALAKHFLSFHNSQGGIHGANVDIGDRLLSEVYGKPFQAAIAESGLKGIMPCYGSVAGLPIHASKAYLTKLLREEMGFEGVVASDYSAVENVYNVQKVGETKADAGYRCLCAGMDVELPLASCYSDELKEMFLDGRADMQVLDRAVLRVLTAKFRMGLFEHPFALDGEEMRRSMYNDQDDEVSRQSAQESLILLKNNGALPLYAEGKTIAVIGPHAGNARYYFGGYTQLSMVEAIHAAANSMAGVGAGGETKNLSMERIPGTNIQVDETEEFHQILRQLHPECKNLVQELTERLPDTRILYAPGYYKAGEDRSRFPEALEIAKQADLVILTLGGKNGSGTIATMGEGVDGTNINLPGCQDAFMQECKKLGKPMIGVHFDGRPISSDTADELLDAIVEAWTPAEFAAEAVVNVLTGAYNPSGKLPLTVARGAGQIPIYYNHPNGSAWDQGGSIGFQDYADMPHTPRYYFGHGLSYTTFDYRDLALSKQTVAPDEDVLITLTVQNTGTVSGTEVVQLYIKDVHASMTRPVMELQGFARVELEPGESKQITFVLSPSQMAFLDEDMKWKIEKGEFEVRIGSSSADIRLKDRFYVQEDLWIEGRARKFWAGVSED